MNRAFPLSDGAPAPSWEPQTQAEDRSVETIELRRGFSVVLSRFHTGASRAFRFTEPDDLFGFGFHLADGASFRLETTTFETRAGDVWACAMPRGSSSCFVLPAGGFSTVSLRLQPAVARELLDGGSVLAGPVRRILDGATEGTGAARLAPMDPADALGIRAMFTTGYGGAARRLFLESCALDLLARRVGDAPRTREEAGVRWRPRHHDKAAAAREHLDANFRTPPTTAELARLVGVNECTLKRAFKQAFGTTLFAYVTRRRMERAEWLLQQGMSVSKAAEDVGYECPRSFAAAFRRYSGRAPNTLRARRS